jgi:large subunit ribosomal protein L14
MIQLQTVLVPADNTGAKKLRVIHIYGGSRRTRASLGDVVRVVVDGADPDGLIKDSEVARAVVVRTRKEVHRADGSYIRFDDNAAVMIDKEGKPQGTRIFGPVAREIKDKGYHRIASLATEVL